jgi:NDP-sugar pyrophosphorylase family protein
MILAAGLGVRMEPLSRLRPKPALPVHGVPVIGYLLELLVRCGVGEVIVNLHHRADVMREAAKRCCPKGLELYFSHEPEILGTGVRDSDPALVLAGDMLLDVDLAEFARRHRERGDAATLLLRSDPRSADFGPVATDAEGAVRRIGNDFDLGGGVHRALFVGVRAFAPRCFDAFPDREGAFEDLRDWLGPLLRAGARDIRGESYDSDALGWEPVGTPAEYLRANLAFDPRFDRGNARARATGTRVTRDLVLGAGARLEPGARLVRAVVWEGETVPGDLDASDGIFADGRFVPVVGEVAGVHAGADA